MSEQRRRRAAEITAEAFEEPIEARSAFIAAACADDEMLRAEVESLLSADAEAGSFLDRPAIRSGAAATAADDAAMAGTPIDGYRIIRRIAAGGMGVVYEAEQENPPRTVAMKVIRAGAVSPQSIRRFEHEGRLLGLLHHPGIAQIYEAGTFDTGQGPQPFFAMEFVDGRPLTEFAESNGLGPRERLELFGRVCDAVHHAHQKGVIHRDLKPGNVLVDESGQPRILDFGVARLTDSDVQATTVQTTTGELIGTIPYMSPEQVAGDADALDTRSDVYSLGVCLYELLSGRLPHDLRRRSIPEAARIIREEDVTPLSSINRVFRGDIETIVAKALEKDRNRRYQSAAELATDIRRNLNDEPIIARPTSTMYQLAKFARRNKSLVGGALAVVLVLVLGAAGTVWKAVEAEGQRRFAEEQQTRTETEARSLATVNEFIMQLFHAVKPAHAMGREVTVREVLDAASERIDSDFSDRPLVEAELRSTIGLAYETLWHLGEAESQLRIALELREAALGADHLKTIATMIDLGAVLTKDLQLAEAERLLRHAHDERMRQLGPDHEATLESMSHLLLLLERASRYEEAEPLARQVVETSQRLYGRESDETKRTRTYLTSVLAGQRRLEAEQPLRDDLDRARREYGDDHPDTALRMNNLAWYLWSERRPAEAEPLFREAFDIARRVFGEDARPTLATLNGLILSLDALGRWDESAARFRALIDREREIHGEASIPVATSMHHLADTLRRKGELREAERLARDALASYREAAPESMGEHVHTCTVLARTLHEAGRSEEAEALLSQAIELSRAALGAEHNWTLSARDWLGWLYLQQNRFAEADPWFAGNLEIRRRALSEDDPRIFMTMNLVAAQYTGQERFEEAERLYLESLDGYRLRYGEQHQDTALSLMGLGALYSKQGRLEEALAMHAQALEIRREVLGPDHPDTLGTIADVADQYARQDRCEQAERMLRVAAEGLRRQQPVARSTGVCLTRLGRCLAELGQPEEAEVALLEAQKILARMLGVGHERTVENIEALVELYEAWGKPDSAAEYALLLTGC